jgi:hypothetical protein
MKKLLLLCVCLLALASPLRAQNNPSADIVVVRVRDGGGDFQVLITRGPGKSELLKFDGGLTDKKFMQSGEGYYTFLSKLYGEGYKLQNSFVNATDSSLTTLIFIKSQ